MRLVAALFVVGIGRHSYASCGPLCPQQIGEGIRKDAVEGLFTGRAEGPSRKRLSKHCLYEINVGIESIWLTEAHRSSRDASTENLHGHDPLLGPGLAVRIRRGASWFGVSGFTGCTAVSARQGSKRVGCLNSLVAFGAGAKASVGRLSYAGGVYVGMLSFAWLGTELIQIATYVPHYRWVEPLVIPEFKIGYQTGNPKRDSGTPLSNPTVSARMSGGIGLRGGSMPRPGLEQDDRHLHLGFGVSADWVWGRNRQD